MDYQKFKRLVDEATKVVTDTLTFPNKSREVIYGNILQLLGGSTQLINDLHSIRSECLKRQFAFGDDLLLCTLIAYTLRDACRNPGKVAAASEEDWAKAIAIVIENKNVLALMSHDLNHFKIIFRQDFAVGLAIGTLVENGIDVELSGEKVSFANDQLKKLTHLFDKMAASIGGVHLIDFIVKDLNHRNLFCSDIGQYFIGRSINTMGKPQNAQVPWGFLWNLALKHIAAAGNANRNTYSSLLTLATNATAIWELQPYSTIEEAAIDADGLLSYMQKSAVYDSIFTIVQMKSEHARNLYQGLWSEEELQNIELHGLRLSFLIKLLDYLLVKSSNKELALLQVDTACRDFRCGKERISKYLEILSHPMEGPNQNFGFPPSFDDVNYREKPLLKLRKGEYLLLPKPMISPLLAEFSVDFCSEVRPSIRDSIGTSLENFVIRHLNKKGIPTKSGKYDLRSSAKAKTANMASDCDIVVEDPKEIFFFECKSKMLRRSSRSGDDLTLMIDLAQSLIHSQKQAITHENLLISNGKLDLQTDVAAPVSIIYEGQQIERISVSLWSYGSLHSDMFVTKFLRFCFRHKFDSANPDVNKKLQSIEKNNLTPFREVAKAAQDFQDSNLRNPVLSSKFISVSHLLLILDFSKDVGSFFKEIKRTKRISFSTRDFAIEYWHARELAKSPKL